jgi:hypothetical protein
MDSIFDTKTQICVKCPASAPIANVTQCQSCSQNTVFNPTTRNCDKCGVGQIVVVNIQGNNICQCPQANPYFDGIRCQACYLPNYWNKTTLTC